MHASDVVLLLMVVIVAALFVGLVFLGREYYRLMQQAADGSRIKALIEQEVISKEIELAADRLARRLRADGEQLQAIAERVGLLCSHRKDEQRKPLL